MKKHKLEIAALTLLFGVICYAFYDGNIKGSEQTFDIVDNHLNNTFISMAEIKSKEDITLEMLSLPREELLKYQKIKFISNEITDKEVEEPVEEVIEEVEEESTEEVNITTSTLSYSEDLAVYDIPYNETLATEIVNFAMQFEGNPYVYGGNSLTNGTDCSGFTKLVFGEFGISLPRSAPDQAYAGVHVNLSNIMPGDIVVSGYDGVVCHASLYIGDGKLIHALNSNVGIVVTDLYIMPIIDVRRVI